MKIIEFNESYLKDIKLLLREEDIDPSTNESYNIELFENSYFMSFLCLNDSEVVGSISLSIRLYVLEINHIFVANNYRGRRVGRSLIEKAFEYGLERKCESVIVNTSEDNFVARKMYEKLGFEKKGEVFDYFNHRKKQLLYMKKLK
ncbi:MAG: GNAT family N-acetyltransferase [Candidatus Woesearchaeota archaeon]